MNLFNIINHIQQTHPSIVWLTDDAMTLNAPSSSAIVVGSENFKKAKDLKVSKSALSLSGIKEYPADTPFTQAIDESYADLLKNHFSLSVGILGDKGFILTGERGIALANNTDEMAQKLSTLLVSRIGQTHNKTILNKIDAFPETIADHCQDMYKHMQSWKKLALFPSYQKLGENNLYPDAEFGFIAKRTEIGTLVTARASNKTQPTDQDITLITDVKNDGTVTVQSLGKKASLNGPLAHLIFAERPDIHYIVHSHVFLPKGVNINSPSAPGTKADWSVIKDDIVNGANIINQPYHGSIILLEKADDLLPLLKSQSLYQTQSKLYDIAYARFQTTETRRTSLENFIATLNLPPETKALDMCCGTGASTQALKDLGLINIDFADGSASMLSVAETRHGKKGTVAKLEDLSVFAGSNYELITMRQAFNYIHPANLKSVFRTAAEALAPGGHLVFNSFVPLPDGTDYRTNSAEREDLIVQTEEINDTFGNIIRHAQRSEIIDTQSAEWMPVLDVNEFYQHKLEDVVQALNENAFTANAHVTGKSICYHGIKP